MPVIEVKNLTKIFKDQKKEITAVDNISFEIKEGEVFGLLGPNGAGKTTTISMLATLQKPSSGTATVNGYDIIKQPANVRKSIGIVFQEPSSDDLLTGYENLKLHALLYGVPGNEVQKRIEESLRLVDLYDRKDEIVKKYSGGMRRRLEIARGLMHTPKILFLDEPTLGLDPQTREHMWHYIERLVKEKKITIILTTHYMDEADRLCGRVAIIDKGKIVVMDEPKKLKQGLGGSVISLKMKQPSIEPFRKLKYVESAKIADSTVFLTVKEPNKHLQEILKLAGDVESVELHSPTLNDVFLHYAGREFTEDSPEGGFFERMAAARNRR